jgi:hypothetical protein
MILNLKKIKLTEDVYNDVISHSTAISGSLVEINPEDYRLIGLRHRFDHSKSFHNTGSVIINNRFTGAVPPIITLYNTNPIKAIKEQISTMMNNKGIVRKCCGQ